MSKRKSRTKSLFVDKDDMMFLDDSDSEIAMKIINENRNGNLEDKNKEGDGANVRSSARAKKQKNIYDPSDNNGPVHKKKKEAMEAQILAESKKRLSSPVKASIQRTPGKTPNKATKLQPIKSASSILKTAADVKKKLGLDKPVVEITVPLQPVATLKVQKAAPQQVPMPMKEPLRAINRKKSFSLRKEVDGGTSSSANSDFEKASTVEVEDKKVNKWTASDVSNYFASQGFDKKESLKFKEQEIDGEALLILNRDDLKELKLRVGTFVKMWNRILTFQSGSSDVTQGWK